MLFRFLQKSKITFKNIVIRFLFYLFIWFFFVYIIYSLFFQLMEKHERLDIYKYCKFDLIANQMLPEYQTFLEEQDLIEMSLKTFRTGGTVYGKNQLQTMSTTLRLDSENYEILFSMFPKKLFLSIDADLLSDKNCALIGESLAKAMHVKVGDTLELAGKSRKIAGIFEDAVRTVLKADSIILWDGSYTNGSQVSSLGSGSIDYYDIYSQVYLQFKDYAAGTEYFKLHYFNHDTFLSEYTESEQFQDQLQKNGDSWAINAITDTDSTKISIYRVNAFATKKTLYAFAKQEFDENYNLKDKAFYSSLCVFALFTVCIMEAYQHAKQNEGKIAVFRILGYHKKHIALFYFLRSVLLQMALMILSITFAKYMTYQSKNLSYVLMTKWFFIFTIIIFIAAGCSAAASLHRLQDKNLLKKLNEEIR